MAATPTQPQPTGPQPRPGHPWPDPAPIRPTGPRVAPITVPVRPCCGVLVSDRCDCACLATQARIITDLSTPILLAVA